jgi:hypothetical protein
MNLRVDPLEHGPLRVFTRGNTVVLEGVLREPEPAKWLCPFIDDIHRQANEHEIKEVELDLRPLEYANAAAWKCIVYWVRLLKEPSMTPYQLHVIGDQKHRWQQVGITTLRIFGEKRLKITVYRHGRLA